MPYLTRGAFIACLLLSQITPPALAASGSVIEPAWNEVVATSNASTSIGLCIYPLIRRGHPLHDKIFDAMKQFGGYQRILAWYPYPHLNVAELQPPRNGVTSWDFSYIDPIVEDFMQASGDGPDVFDFGALPNWIFTDTPQPVPADPDELVWNYNAYKPVTSFFRVPSGEQRRLDDKTIELIANYQARVASWYTKGGFFDEYGVWHNSGHFYKMKYWEVLSEPDFEHNIHPADYTRIYDAVVEAVRRVDPDMKFIGPALGSADNPEYFFQFLNPANHKAGIPLDMASFHFYAKANTDETMPVSYQHSIFQQVDGFVNQVRYVNSIRDHLSPNTQISVSEIGAFLPGMMEPKLVAPIPPSYWNMVGAMSAYAYARLAALGVNMVIQTEVIDYPGQTAATSLVDWETGKPNGRYWAVKMLRDNFGPGDKLVAAPLPKKVWDVDRGDQVFYQGFVSPEGVRRILIVNKRESSIEVSVPGALGGSVQIVDAATNASPAAAEMKTNDLKLDGYAVAVVTVK